MPRRGFNALEAIPVLNFLLGMSTIALPVVSEPVPAVHGTETMRVGSARRVRAERRKRLTGYKWPKNVTDGKPFACIRSIVLSAQKEPTFYARPTDQLER